MAGGEAEGSAGRCGVDRNAVQALWGLGPPEKQGGWTHGGRPGHHVPMSFHGILVTKTAQESWRGGVHAA